MAIPFLDERIFQSQTKARVRGGVLTIWFGNAIDPGICQFDTTRNDLIFQLKEGDKRYDVVRCGLDTSPETIAGFATKADAQQAVKQLYRALAYKSSRLVSLLKYFLMLTGLLFVVFFMIGWIRQSSVKTEASSNASTSALAKPPIGSAVDVDTLFH